MSVQTFKTDFSNVLCEEGKVLDSEKLTETILRTVSNMCSYIGQNYLTETKSGDLSEVLPIINSENEILINLRIRTIYYKIIGIITEQDGRKILTVTSFGAV